MFLLDRDFKVDPCIPQNLICRKFKIFKLYLYFLSQVCFLYLQVHYTFVKGNLKLQMPPLYSLVIQVIFCVCYHYFRTFLKLFLNSIRTKSENIVIQESEKGSWHVPLALDTSNESSRPWLCITRASADDAVTASNDVNTSGNSHLDQPLKLVDDVRSLDSQVIEKNSSSLTGKRKERSDSS